MLVFYVNEKTSKGKSLLEFAKKLKAPASSVRISKNEHLLTAEELALPMKRKPTDAELREYLNQKPGKTIDMETVRKRALNRLKQKTK